MRTIKSLLFIAATCVPAVTMSAQSLDVDGKTTHWEGALSAGITTNCYEWGFGIAYFPSQYIGVKASLGFASEIERAEDWGREDWESDNIYASRFKLNPSIVLRTPRLINIPSQGAGLYLFAEPGVVLSPGAQESTHARWLSKDIKGGINMQVDRLIFSVGYGYSNFNIYSGRPYNAQGSDDDYDRPTHSIFISIAGKF